MLRMVLLALLLLLPAARAQLVWDTTEVPLAPALTDTTSTAQFTARNTGTAPVRLTAVRTDCGCATATATPTTVAPGATVTLAVAVTLGPWVGTMRKRALISTDTGPETTLTVVLTMPELATATPRMLRWSTTALDEKTVALTLVPGAKVTLRGVPAAFTATLTPGADAQQQTLHLTPRTATAGEADFAIVVTLPDGRQQELRVFTRLVMPAN